MLYHVGLDTTGHRHRRLCTPEEARRRRLRKQLRPVLVLTVTPRAASSRSAFWPCQQRWRNGLQRRSFLLLTEQTRAERRCFLMTLPRPPLVPPVRPF